MRPKSQGATHIPGGDDRQEAGGVVPYAPAGESGAGEPSRNGQQALRLTPKGMAHKGSGDVRRRHALERLARRLVELQARLAAVREATRDLSAIELERRLNPDEARRARSLRWESERLGHELKLLRQSFEALMVESRVAESN